MGIKEQQRVLTEIRAQLSTIKQLYQDISAVSGKQGFSRAVGEDNVRALQDFQTKLSQLSKDWSELQTSMRAGRALNVVDPNTTEQLKNFRRELNETTTLLSAVNTLSDPKEVKFLNQAEIDRVRDLKQSVSEIRNVLGDANTRGLERVFDDIESSAALTKEDYKLAAQELRKIATASFKKAQGPISRRALGVLGGGVSSIASGLTTDLSGQFRSPFTPELLQQYANFEDILASRRSARSFTIDDSSQDEIRRMLDVLGVSGDEFDEKFRQIELTLGDFAEAAGGTGSEIRDLSLELRNNAKEVQAYYSAVNKYGTSLGKLQGQQARFNFETGDPITLRKNPQFRARAIGATGVVQPGSDQAQFYSEVSRAVSGFRAELEQTADTLPQEYSAEILKASVSTNELTGEVEVAIPFLQRMGDEAERAGTAVKKFHRDNQGNLVEGDPTRLPLEDIETLFDPKALTRFNKNLDAALSETSLTLDNVKGGMLDYSDGLVRVNVQSDSLTGVSRRLNLIFDKQGNVVNDLSTRFSNFGRALQQNLSRVLRWAIATTVIYGAINELQQIPRILADIDQASARFEAITGLSFERVNEYFNSTIETAQRFGVELQDALPAAEFALQAVGGDDQAQAMQLLADSMLLTKITGDDLRTTIEVLSAALSQFNLEQDQGSELMGKWISINREYSVTLSDLARAYSVAGTVAQEYYGEGEEAIDSFNALITVASREVPLSATQLGNFLKTVFSTASGDEAVETFRRYGISIKDSEGNLRDMNEVLMEANLLTQQFDAAAPEALTDLSKALTGGGSRLSSYAASLIAGIGDAEDIEETSRNATEAASENYAQFVETLTNNLKDNFQELNLEVSKLLKSVGEENVIPFLQKTINALTELTKLVSTLNTALDGGIGKFVALSAAILPITRFLGNVEGLDKLNAALLGGGQAINLGGITKGLKSAISNAQLGLTQSATLGIGAGLIDGILDGMAASENKFRTGAVSFITTGLLAAAGAAALGPVGAIITTQLAGFIQEGINEGLAQRDLAKSLTDNLTPGNLQDKDFLQNVIDQIGTDETALANFSFRAAGVRPSQFPMLDAEVMKNATSRDDFADPAQQLAYDFYQALIGAIREEAAKAEAEIAEEAAQTLQASYGFARREMIKQQYVGPQGEVNSSFALEQERLRRRAFNALSSEDLSASDYRKTIDRIGDIQPAIQAWDALGSKFESSGESFYEVFGTLAESRGELTDFFGELVAEINNLQNAIEAANEAGEDTSGMEASLAALRNNAQEIYGVIDRNRLEQAGAFTLPSFTNVGDASAQDVQRAAEIGRKLQREYSEMIYDSNRDEFQQMGFNSFTEWYDGFVQGIDTLNIVGDEMLMQFEGLESQFFQMGKNLGDQMNEGMDESFNVRRLKDVDPSQMAEIEAANRYWVNYLANIRGQSTGEYIQEEGVDMNLILGENNVFNKILTTNEAMNFVLQDILDTEKKQLEGMWNIPEGATFWVPITSAFQQSGGGGGYPSLPPIQDTRTGGSNIDEVLDGIERLVDDREIYGITKNRTFDDYVKTAYDFMGLTEEKRQQRRTPTGRGELDIGTLSAMQQVNKLNLDALSELRMKDRVRKEQYNPLTPTGPKPKYYPFEDRLPGSSLEKGAQALNVNVVVPEPKDIKVESTINANLYLDGARIATYVRKVLSRELGRTIANKRYSVPGRV